MSGARDWLSQQTEHAKPFRAVGKVTDIDYEELWHLGVRALVFDLENTLAPYRADALVDGHLELLARLKGRGFALSLISNSTRSWVEAVAVPLGIPYVGKAGKPRAVAFFRVVARLPVPAVEVAVIGDQILTDIYGAQRLGLRAILVDPLGPAEPWTSKLQRRVAPVLVRTARAALSLI